MRIFIAVLFLVSLGSVAAPADACPPGCGDRQFHGKKITIDLSDAEIGNVIRLIGEVSGTNIVFGDDVKGKVTLKLKNVPWDQALDVVLRSHALGFDETDGVLFVAPQATLDAAEERRLDLEAKGAQSGPLTTRVLPLNYASAQDMIDKVKPLLSPRGSVTADQRTNSLIIRDVRGSGALSF